MLIKLNDELLKDKIGVVVAIFKYKDRVDYFYCTDVYQTHPTLGEAREFSVIDNKLPDGWKEVKYSERGIDYSIASFSQWANEPLFLNWLMEDEWQPDKTKEAVAILSAKLTEYVEMHAANRFGSVEAAKEALLKSRFEHQLKDASDRGFERPAEPDLSDTALQSMRLNVHDLGELYGAPRD